MEKSIEFPGYKVVAAGQQIVGKRERQEDAFRLTISNTPGQKAYLLSIMSDGMGGMGDGDIAGVTIVSSFLEAYKNQQEKDLFAALRSANLALREMKQNGNVGLQAGGTFIGVQVGESGVSWLSIGDSLLYHQRGSKVRKINAEHTWGRELERRVRQGEMTEQEAAESTLPRHALFAAVCGDNIPAVDVCDPAPCHIGERFIIASDGLLTILNNPESVFNEPGIRRASPEQACTTLLNRVQAADSPHQDNCSVLIIDICEPTPAEKEPSTEIVTKHSAPPVGAWRSCVISEIGDRGSQQDSTLVLHSENAVLAVVADGAGGHADGAVASSTAVESMKELWHSTLSAGIPAEKAAQVLSDGIIAAHQSILQKAGGNHKRCGKSAIVVLYLCGQHYTIANAGDCRAYQATDKDWQLLTKDDSLLQLMLDKGMVTPEEAINHPDQSVLTQALGGETPPKPHVVQGKIAKGSSYLLCCDGLWNQLPAHWANAVWSCDSDTAGHRNELSRQVGLAIKNAKGDSDNVSAVWVYSKDNAAPAAHSRVSGITVISAVLLSLLLGLVAALLCAELWEGDETQRTAGTGTQQTPAEVTPQPQEPQDPAEVTPQPQEPQDPAEVTPQPQEPQDPAEVTPQPQEPQGPAAVTPQPQEPQGPAEITPQPQEPQPKTLPTTEETAQQQEQESPEKKLPTEEKAQHEQYGPEKMEALPARPAARPSYGAPIIRHPHRHGRNVYSVEFSSVSQSSATGSRGNAACITEFATGSTFREIRYYSFMNVVFSHVGK